MLTQDQIAENRRRAIENARKKAADNQRKLSDTELTIMSHTGVVPSPAACYGDVSAAIEPIDSDAIISGKDLRKLWLDNGKCSRMKLKEMLGGRSHSQTAAQFLRRRVSNLDEDWPTWEYDTSHHRRPFANGIDPHLILSEMMKGKTKAAVCRKYRINGITINRLLTLAFSKSPNDARHE